MKQACVDCGEAFEGEEDDRRCWCCVEEQVGRFRRLDKGTQDELLAQALRRAAEKK